MRMRMMRSVAGLAAGLAFLVAPEARADDAKVSSVEFLGMAPPSTVDERADVYTAAKVKLTYRNGRSETLDLKFHK
ncbi:MAG: hypothetical protein H6Q88_2071, partial [Anaeromyxobacteraceae bacterium]|nr:hypothetical protein [Anaeromyxobacteraceae bacterium]